jgi:two-component sensor histidine kinase/ligand-binding sensor protein
MEAGSTTRPLRVLWFGVLLVAIALSRVYSYLLFHSLIEIFDIVVLAALFILAWNTRHLHSHAYLLFFGIMSMSLAILTVLHLLAYSGMGVFPEHDANLQTQLWIASRYLLSLSMLVAPLLVGRKLNENAVMAGYGVLTLVLIATIFGGAFPTTYVEGIGLTPFKRISEYVISGIFLVSIGSLHQKRQSFDPSIYRLLIRATGVMVVAELAFILYRDVYDLFTMGGHLLTLVSFYLVYVALVETGLRRPYALLFRDLQKRNTELEAARDRLEVLWTQTSEAEAALRESEQQVRRKLNAILLPEGDLATLELADVVDIPALQELMDTFYAITHFGVGIVDLKGRVLVATGWQDVCTQYHRACPQTSARCRESDIALSEGVMPGTFKAYKCRNGMWDMVTPISVGETHVGNLFLGQFLYEDEIIDDSFFRAQAQDYGFNEAAYLAALARVPRWSHAEVEQVMEFYATFAHQLSELSYANIRLAGTLAERDELLTSLQDSLDEKTVLLREVHHRVKNNLTTIIGLVVLQQNTISDPTTVAQFQELEGRVRSISMVHELLYGSRTLSRINFESYLQTLVSRLQDTLDVDDEVEMTVAAPNVVMNVDVAVPCGLIVNELVTNAFKYAFPPTRRANGGPGYRISVTADYDGELLTLAVSDNGVGLPATPVAAPFTDLEPYQRRDASGGLGLHLVRILGEHQLNGQIEIEHGAGTTFRLRFDPRRFDR